MSSSPAHALATEKATVGEVVGALDLPHSDSMMASSSLDTDAENVDTYPETDPPSNPLAGGKGPVKYNTMSWWHVGLLMIAETMSLGILALPSAIAAVGLFPGIVILVGLGFLATYSGYVIGQFKLAHPNVLSMADAGQVMFGPIGREILAWSSVLSFVFIMSAHVLTFSVMMNVLTGHSSCSILFGLTGFLISFALTLPRTLKDVSYVSIASCVSIVSAVVLVMASLGATKRGGTKLDIYVSGTDPAQTFVAVLNMVLAYSGNVAFFGFISELRDPKTYPKALYMLQGTAIAIYVIVAVVIYYYVGRGVASPALSAASPVVRKIAYGIAIPTIVVAGVINASVAAKYLYVRLWRDYRKKPSVIAQNSFESFGSWAIICAVIWLLAFIIAEAIPGFNELLAFVSALFMGWFTYGISGFLWLKLNKGSYFKSWRTTLLFAANTIMICLGLVIILTKAVWIRIIRNRKGISRR